MKTRTHRMCLILGIAATAGISMLPIQVGAQEPTPPAAPSSDAGQPLDFSKVRGMVREMVELRRAGKEEEANRMAERIKEATRHNPRVVAMLEREKKAKNPATRGDGPPERRAAAKAKEKQPKADAAPAEQNPVARLRHLRVAASHLEAAGVKGLADQVRSQISQMERRMKFRSGDSQDPKPTRPLLGRPGGTDSAKRPDQPSPRPFANPQRGFGAAPGNPGRAAHGPRPQRLGAPAPASDPNTALLDEVRKLHREMGELRAQMQQLQSKTTRPQRPMREVPELSPEPPRER